MGVRVISSKIRTPELRTTGVGVGDDEVVWAFARIGILLAAIAETALNAHLIDVR